MAKFEIGKTYIARCIGDHTLTDTCTIIARTAKTITFVDEFGTTYKKRVKEYNGREFAPACVGNIYA